ncbi:Cif family virulence factor [Spirosoma flavum]|uniref:Calcium/calmodulin-dependent protein kinase II association-domain domain-containing protein n=1 Tax=Spirosoma flavum TaxID=2048557 RepID=A0ABW6AQ72_9BACT
MKTSLLVTALVLSTVIFGWAQADNEAIKRVLRSETEGFFKRDKAEWSNAWAHTPYIHFAANLYGGDFMLVKGWNKLEKQFASQFKSSKISDKVAVRNSNYTIHQNGNMAFVAYDQTLIDSHGKTTSKESRTLEKLDGQWKIINVTALTNLKSFGLAQTSK